MRKKMLPGKLKFFYAFSLLLNLNKLFYILTHKIYIYIYMLGNLVGWVLFSIIELSMGMYYLVKWVRGRCVFIYLAHLWYAQTPQLPTLPMSLETPFYPSVNLLWHSCRVDWNEIFWTTSLTGRGKKSIQIICNLCITYRWCVVDSTRAWEPYQLRRE